LSAYDAGELYEVGFPHHPMHDSEALTLGNVRIEARHTPGHTPEHLAFLGYELARAPTTPALMLSGDFLLIGSLGRPDLMGEAAKVGLANALYDSVTRVLAALPDGLEVHPAHGAGSMCGSGMSARPMSTLGFERVANPYLRAGLGRDAFVAEILGHVPPFPPYYKRMKQLNARGPAALDLPRPLEAIEAPEFHALVESGCVVVDVRDQLSFGAGHIPGAFGVGVSGSQSTWVAWVVPYETPLLIACDHPSDAEATRRALVRVGLDDVRGYLDGGMSSWIEGGYPVAHTRQVSPLELAAELPRGCVTVVDVRSDEEFDDGRVAGARHLTAATLAEHATSLPRDGVTLALMCGTGYRSTVAASVLERSGFTNVVNVTGGMGAWQHAGLPVERSR
jgi:hydroxyacylglutathione hydrolase